MLKYKENCVYFNTKIKTYRDGSQTLIRCNRRIFKSPDFENCVDERKATILNFEHEKEISEHLDKHCFVFHDAAGNLTEIWDVSEKQKKERNTDNVRSDSLKRAKDKIFDIVFENDWKYFITITFNGKDFDRNDPATVFKKLKKWLDNKVQRNGLKYILVPEYHKKGGIHCHALINDCDLIFEDSGTRLVKGYNKPLKIYTIDKLGIDTTDLKIVYNIKNWKYGFSTAIETYGSPSQLAFYITKYITKDCKKIFGKFFLSSKNLKRSPEITLTNSDFDLNKPIFSPSGSNTAYQYESDITFSSQVEENTQAILDYLKQNGLD